MAEKEELDYLLDDWQDIPAGDPHLKHRVWTRIAADDSETQFTYQNWLSGITSVLSRPLVAAAFIAASIAGGLIIAELQVSQEKQIRTRELAQNYMELINSQQESIESEAGR